MVFLFCILILVAIIITLLLAKIEVEIQNFEFSSINKQINENYVLFFRIVTFKKIPIIRIKITKNKLHALLNKRVVKEKISKIENKLVDNFKFDIKMKKMLKTMPLDIKKIVIEIAIGTENSAITAFIAPTIYLLLSNFIFRKIEKFEAQKIKVTPIFINQNIINISFSGIFQIKMIHIINTIYIMKKEGRVKKNGRTSNRRSYDYSYE